MTGSYDTSRQAALDLFASEPEVIINAFAGRANVLEVRQAESGQFYAFLFVRSDGSRTPVGQSSWHMCDINPLEAVGGIDNIQQGKPWTVSVERLHGSIEGHRELIAEMEAATTLWLSDKRFQSIWS